MQVTAVTVAKLIFVVSYLLATPGPAKNEAS